jgi:hypothetical protein
MSPDTAREALINRLQQEHESAPYVEGYLVGYLYLVSWPCRWKVFTWQGQDFYLGQRAGDYARCHPWLEEIRA